jgi:hypothetical protein
LATVFFFLANSASAAAIFLASCLRALSVASCSRLTTLGVGFGDIERHETGVREREHVGVALEEQADNVDRVVERGQVERSDTTATDDDAH